MQIEFKSLPLARSTVSGSTDSGTSSTVFLFEEFVPLEYHQQLSAGIQNKRTSGSFSPGKTKRWKQAATLDGRPYVVGHVPRSLNSREAEFEGLLRGNNSSMKVISLGETLPTPEYLLALHRSFTGAYSTRHIFTLVRCAAGGKYTSSVYPSHPNRHPSRHPRHRKRKQATYPTTHRPSMQSAPTHVWPDPFASRRR